MTKENKPKNNINFEVNTEIYPKEAIISTCYLFLDRTYIYLDSGEKPEKININLTLKDKTNEFNLKSLKNEFLNELLHNTERLLVAKRNKRLREFIVGKALFSAMENNETTEDDEDDPLGLK